MFEQKKRPKVEPPATQEQPPKTLVIPPETEGLTNQLKEAERDYSGLIEICSVCFKHGCHQAPSIWVREGDPICRNC